MLYVRVKIPVTYVTYVYCSQVCLTTDRIVVNTRLKCILRDLPYPNIIGVNPKYVMQISLKKKKNNERNR